MEAFAWCDELLGGEGFRYKTAGSRRQGQVVWLLAKSPFEVDLPDSPVEMYVMLTNTHDGSVAVTAAVTPVRVVCMNTLRSALNRAQASYRIRHTVGAQARLDEAQRVLGLARGAAERIRQRAGQLALTRISDGDWHAFLESLVPDPPESQQGQTRAVRLVGCRLWWAPGQADACNVAVATPSGWRHAAAVLSRVTSAA